MDALDGSSTVEPNGEPTPEDRPTLTAHESRPGRTILTEEGNADAWIASDLVVDAPR